jgi:hypothetical protein
MIRNPRTLGFIIPIFAVGSPSFSLASENVSGLRCAPIKDVCLAQIKDVDFCNQIEQKCVTRLLASVAHPAPPPPSTAVAQASSLPSPSSSPAEGSSGPPQQYVFVRADKLDNPYPGLSAAPSAGQALGASISYTGNEFVQALKTTKYGSYVNVTTTDAITVSGLASLVIIPPYSLPPIGDQNVDVVSSIAVSANGNWDHPTKTFGETSALKAGPEFDFLFSPTTEQQPGAPYFTTYAGVGAFYQTDFYGKAQAEGATLSLTPSNWRLHLMGSDKLLIPQYVDGFFEVRAEATYLNVGQPGHTNLHIGSYEWLGGAVRSYLFFFPSIGGWSKADFPYLVDRVSFVGTYQNYWDANSHGTAGLFSAALQYKLTGCDNSVKSELGPGKQQPVLCDYGSPSLSAQYDWGTDRDTLQHTKKIQVKLNYAY